MILNVWYNLKREDKAFVFGLGWRSTECICALRKASHGKLVEDKTIDIFYELAKVLEKAELGWEKLKQWIFSGKNAELMSIYEKVQAIFLEYMIRTSFDDLSIDAVKSEITKTKQHLNYVGNQIRGRMLKELMESERVKELIKFLKFVNDFAQQFQYM